MVRSICFRNIRHIGQGEMRSGPGSRLLAVAVVTEWRDSERGIEMRTGEWWGCSLLHLFCRQLRTPAIIVGLS